MNKRTRSIVYGSAGAVSLLALVFGLWSGDITLEKITDTTDAMTRVVAFLAGLVPVLLAMKHLTPDKPEGTAADAAPVETPDLTPIAPIPVPDLPQIQSPEVTVGESEIPTIVPDPESRGAGPAHAWDIDGDGHGDYSAEPEPVTYPDTDAAPAGFSGGN